MHTFHPDASDVFYQKSVISDMTSHESPASCFEDRYHNGAAAGICNEKANLGSQIPETHQIISILFLRFNLWLEQVSENTSINFKLWEHNLKSVKD